MKPKASPAIRVTRRAVLAPLSETVVMVTNGKGGEVLLEVTYDIYHRKRITLADGVAKVQPNTTFWSGYPTYKKRRSYYRRKKR